MIKPRYAAANSVDRIVNQHLFSNKETVYWLRKTDWTREDQGLYLRLVYGTLENLLLIDAIIEKISGRNLSALDVVARKFLRVSVYQMIFTDRIPDYAVINEAVEMTKNEKQKAAGFVNAILRNIQRKIQKSERDDLWLREFWGQDEVLKYSHAPWIVKKLQCCFDAKDVQMILEAHQKPPVLTIRVNTLKGDALSVARQVAREGISTTHIPCMPEAYLVEDSTSLITDTASYKEGCFQIQSLASMLTVHWLDPQPGETVIDVAAAPGGKTTHISQRMNNQGRIIARDISETRLKQVQQHMKRLGCSNITLEKKDGTIIDCERIGKADRVLVDAPCSSMGMIRKKPELKFLYKASDFTDLPGLQLKLLESAAKMVKPGGVLLYSTCTYFDEENKDVIMAFLQRNKSYILTSLESLSQAIDLDPEQLRLGMIQLGPHMHPLLDGFFVAKLIKKPE